MRKTRKRGPWDIAKVRQYIWDRGWTLEHTAKRAGISESALYKWLGERVFSKRTARHLAETFGVTVKTLRKRSAD